MIQEIVQDLNFTDACVLPLLFKQLSEWRYELSGKFIVNCLEKCERNVDF